MEKILILDYGSQYTQLIARRLRELNVYSEILAPSHDLDLTPDVKGLILSGGPQSVYDEGAPTIAPELLDGSLPVLGICYGMQLMTRALGGKVIESHHREYGKAFFSPSDSSSLLAGWQQKEQIWMSHGDRVEKTPEGFSGIGGTPNAPLAAMAHESKPLYAIQFHPEVVHTPSGGTLLKNFLFEICGCAGNWTLDNMVESITEETREQVGGKGVLCAISGGVDSSVMALILNKAVGSHLHCLFIDTGLLRKDEADEVQERFREKFHIQVHCKDATEEFYQALKGISDPEAKRKAIGKTFIDVFQSEAKKMNNLEILAQGTIYPDRIESSSIKGPSAVIKSHHNVGGLPESLHMDIVEPLKNLFKDEVRKVGGALGLDPDLAGRHPFPGPGLAVRIPGEVSKEKVAILQEVDHIFLEEIRRDGLYDDIAQAFAVLLPVKTVGVMGDKRTYEFVTALRAVTTDDFMTADVYPFSPEFLSRTSSRIVNQVRGVNRVVYDITSKPPGTIEWE